MQQRQVFYVNFSKNPEKQADLLNNSMFQNVFTPESILSAVKDIEAGLPKTCLVAHDGFTYGSIDFILNVFATFDAKIISNKGQYFLAAVLLLPSNKSPQEVFELVNEWKIFEPESVGKLKGDKKIFSLNPLSETTEVELSKCSKELNGRGASIRAIGFS